MQRLTQELTVLKWILIASGERGEARSRIVWVAFPKSVLELAIVTEVLLGTSVSRCCQTHSSLDLLA